MEESAKQQITSNAIQQTLIQQRNDAHNMVCDLNARLMLSQAELSEALEKIAQLTPKATDAAPPST